MFATIKYHKNSNYSTPNTLNAEGVPRKGHTSTDLAYCTETGHGRNNKLQSSSPPFFHLLQLFIYFNVNNIKISVTRKGNSSWQTRVYIKQLVGFHLEYCILHICWLLILHHTHTLLCMQDRQVLQESNDLACKERIKEPLRWTEEGTDMAQHPKGNKNRGKNR